MRGLLAAVIGMGVLIVAGVAVLAILLVQRMSSVPVPIASAPASMGPPSAVLDEPEGTRIAGVSLGPDRAAVQLQGGGPDRAAIVDLRTGRVVGRIALAH